MLMVMCMIKTDVHTTNHEAVENLAFAHWQYNANEKAYENKLITKTMYEFAKEEMCKSIDLLEKICYGVSNKAGDNNGFIKNKAAIG